MIQLNRHLSLRPVRVYLSIKCTRLKYKIVDRASRLSHLSPKAWQVREFADKGKEESDRTGLLLDRDSHFESPHLLG